MLKSWFTAVFTIALGCTNMSLQTSGMTAPIKIVISFSTDDLVGQMTQIDISVLMTDDTRTLYASGDKDSGDHHGGDGVHPVRGAIFVHRYSFGQQINAAALFHPDMVYEQGRITARDTLATGIPWIFGPFLGISRNPLWPQTFESQTLRLSVKTRAMTRRWQMQLYVVCRAIAPEALDHMSMIATDNFFMNGTMALLEKNP
ncbi:Family 3 Glycosyl hydrolase [Phytophthora palmivora]|uniref:Family 3 Glycosyl hydrolase n=1 Tax=Phytophthora palmivora TaxID=4796 RepID=A0A2P4YEV8_9STRA|nr:Family 3 Glycosyl hydrolase [Phytophthora palmivora]